MTRRRWVFLGLASMLALGLAAWFLWPSPAVRAYNRIRLGMTPEEVETAIGVPPGYQDGIIPVPPSMSPSGTFIRETGLPHYSLPDARNRPAAEYSEKLSRQHWTWEDYWIWVAYDRTGRVIGYYLLEAHGHVWRQSNPTLFDRIRTWLGL